MKVATQNVTFQVSLPLSSSQLLTVNVKDICQLVIQQLVALLPTLVVWVAYHDLSTSQRQLVVQEPEAQLRSTKAISDYSHRELSHRDFAYLQQEKWWRDDLVNVNIHELNVSGGYHTYVCPLSQQSSIAEYILVCTFDPLSVKQQQLLLGNAQILSNYLAMYRERSHYQSEINCLAQLLGQAEHQLRNPLALINLCAENLRLVLPDGSLREQATLIRQTVDELSSKLTDLLYRGQRARLKIKKHNLQTILAQSIKSLQPWLTEKQLQINFPEKPVYVSVDEWQMKQVFDNLLTNAIHFSPRGGKVTCNWHTYRNEVLIEICDRGSGIAAEDLKQIFKPYYSRRVGGTGLGLAIAKKIILEHQGNLWAENLPEGGAQFSFTLPITK
ncbi:sensor histidine kinase KdpD [Nostoc sp. FACHB-110]|uniref:sensor histidine kinase n=1 Tax=Nostoc sp. FACHB-110 TaxID=2692834 RepID=UPI001687818A|nr:HAMP domain-containing sensor histidine kinase [Nostoc sp. FACHB-110]MBD2440143.1 HAMP domain-containing histidine kinase [Nostoc sp. FACHB-110]